jgi:catecholate siderophore receptor
MAIRSARHQDAFSNFRTAPAISKLAWSKATIGIASAMLIPDSADAQPAQSNEDLPQVRVTAPKRQAKRQPVRRAPAAGPAVAAPAATTAPASGPIVGDGAGVAGYSTPTQSGLSRYPVPLANTPQTVNVVPQQLMQDQRTTSVQEALRNVPGITFTAGEGGVQGDNVTIRGYTARNDFYRDGIRDPGWYARDAFSFDRVEVYKGPSSFLFGRGSTGGVINIVSKLPQARDFGVIEETVNTAVGSRTFVDFNKTFGDVATRLAAVGYMTDIQDRDFTNVRRFGVAPSISYQFTPQTKNTFGYIYQKDDNKADRGIVLLPGSYFGTPYRQPAPVPRNTYFGVATKGQEDVERTEAHNFINRFEHEFTPGLKFTNLSGASYVERFNRTRPVQLSGFNTATSNLFTSPVYNANPPANDPNRIATPTNPLTAATPLTNLWIQNTNHFQNQTNNLLLSNVSDINARFATGFLEHNVLAGVEVSREERTQDRINFTDTYRINVANPNPWVTGTLAPTTASTETNANAVGVYLQDQIKVTNWLELLGGVRFDKFDAEQNAYTTTRATGVISQTPNTPFNLSTDNSFVTYRAGVVVHPTEWSSLYYMRGTSANPPAEFTTITNGQQAFKPITSTIDEIGAKADLLNKQLSVNAAVFRIRKENDLENRGSAAAPDYVAVGTTQVEGFEIGATGRLTPEWSIFGGYAYLKSKVVNSQTVANIGHELAVTPQNSFSIYTTYDITPQWTIGGGAFYVDSRWSSVTNDGRIPDYWRFDAMTSYKVTRNLAVQFNVYNLADEYYYDTVAGAGYAVPGAGRYYSLSARAQF